MSIVENNIGKIDGNITDYIGMYLKVDMFDARLRYDFLNKFMCFWSLNNFNKIIVIVRHYSTFFQQYNIWCPVPLIIYYEYCLYIGDNTRNRR